MLIKILLLLLPPNYRISKDMNNKAILLGRVSTEGQDLDQQTVKLYEAAKRDGYTEDNIFCIAVKESGISLAESEREGIAEMKKLIEGGEPIDCIYIYEVTRLARRGDVNFNVKQYLVDRKIQLVCLKPEFRLLSSDGEVNQMANVAFGMLAVFAEQEMYNAKDRMNRGKQAAKERGQFVGGRLRYGYRLNKYKRFDTYEPEAAIVREVFDMMCSGLHSYNSIAREMVERGEDGFKDLKQAFKKVQNILKGEAYCGGQVESEKGYNYVYPAIIDKETYEKAQAQLAKNQLKPKRVYKHVFLGRGILKDYNGFTLCGKKREKGGNYYAHSTHSNSGLSIAAAPIDKALWIIAKAQYKNKVELEKALGQDDMKERLLEVHGKLEAARAAVAEIQTKLDRIEERYIIGKLSASKADELEAELNKQMMREQKNITKYEDQIRQLEAPIEESVRYIDNIDAIEDPELQHKIILEVIEYVLIVKEQKNHYRMEVNYKPLFSGAGFTQIFQISTQLYHQSLKTGNLQFKL